MTGVLYKLAIFVAALTFVIRVGTGNPILSSVTRSGIVFLGILVTFFVGGHLLRLGIAITEPRMEEPPEDEDEVTEVENN